MLKKHRALIGALLAMLVMGGLVIWGSIGALTATGESADGLVVYGSRTGAQGTYHYVAVTGLTPYVFAPTGAGSADTGDYTNVTAMAETYGDELDIVAAVNAGIFYNAGTATQYCFYYKEADGVVIADGVVLKSAESIDHTECDILVIDEDGNAGWADYWADADALAAGTGTYHDIYGQPVTGKKIVSAVTGFVPIVVAGENVYDPADTALYGYDNYVGHYTQSAARQVFGVRADGTWVLLANTTSWTLDDAAEAALAEGCVFAYNLDGGGSAETVVAVDSEDGYDVRTVRSQLRGTRPLPTYIVFTATDEAPVSATPVGITAALSQSVLPVGASWGDVARALTVTEQLVNANGKTSERVLTCLQGVDEAEEPAEHFILGGGNTAEKCEIKKQSVSPKGWLYYVKTEADTALSLRNNANTRADGAYYDYSTGYTLFSYDNLNTPGVKTIYISYVPGGGLDPLTTYVTVTLG